MTTLNDKLAEALRKILQLDEWIERNTADGSRAHVLVADARQALREYEAAKADANSRPRCNDPECTCQVPTFTDPMEALRFLSGRFKFSGIGDVVARSYARDIDTILEREAAKEPMMDTIRIDTLTRLAGIWQAEADNDMHPANAPRRAALRECADALRMLCEVRFEGCPHAAPSRYCPECVVHPCPIGLDRATPNA